MPKIFEEKEANPKTLELCLKNKTKMRQHQLYESLKGKNKTLSGSHLRLDLSLHLSQSSCFILHLLQPLLHVVYFLLHIIHN